MRSNRAKARLQAGETIHGVVVRFPSPAIVEMFGHLGFDFVMIDSEHGEVDVLSSQDLMRAAEVTGMTPIVRVPYLHHKIISRALDIGAHGVQVPNVDTSEDALTVVRAVKYWPEGERGMAMARSGDYGMTMTWTEYVAKANDETMIVAHIESKEAVQNLPELLKVDGIDVFFIGPMDLSQSLGYPGQPGQPVVQKTIDETIARIREAGRVAGIFVSDVASALRYREMGVRHLMISADCLIRQVGSDYLRAVKGS